MTDAPSNLQASLLMRAAEDFHPKIRRMRFLEHKVLAAARLEAEQPVELDIKSRLPQHIGRDILAKLLSWSARARITLGVGESIHGEGLLDCKDILQKWSACFSLDDANSAVAWITWSPLAEAIVAGSWSVDVTPVTRMTIWDGAVSAQRPVSPSAGMLKALLDQPVDVRHPQLLDGVTVSPKHLVHDPPKGFTKAFSPFHMVNSMRATQAVASQKDASDNADANLRFWYPDDYEHRRKAFKDANHIMPSRNTLERSRVRFDIACMLEWRARRAESGPIWRYISIDASPQRPGTEILVQVERVILQDDILVIDGKPKVEIRRMPIVVLGHGRCGLADKVQASQHQTWLEYGPSLERVRQANYDVRQVLTDMGVEVGIADYADASQICCPSVGQLGEAAAVQESPAWLFPLALYIPGPQHIICGVLKDSVESLPWWPAWTSSAKTVCQWVANLSHRESVQLVLKRRFSDHPELINLVKTLDTTVERFATWRWNTLHRATKTLARVEKAIRLYMDSVTSPAELGTRDHGVAKTVFDACQDATFWNRNRGLKHVIQPLHELSSWLRGCDCHEELLTLKRKQEVICEWKGCRAAGLSDRLRVAKDEMLAIRAKAEGLDTPVETMQLMSKMLGIFGVKFEWVDEPPYTVWQARSPAKAAEFLRRHDEILEQGGQPQPHRVCQHFCAFDSPLRQAMVDHAAGKGTSDKLRQELLSYQFCMLDDTWVEAGHRDVSGVQATKPSGRAPYVAATTRLRQNLHLWDNGNQERIATFFRKYRAMGHLGDHLGGHPKRRRRVRVSNKKTVSRKSIVKHVYRLGEQALANWSARLACIQQHSSSPLLQLVGAPTLKMVTKLKVEYLTSAMKAGALLSLPNVTMQVAEEARVADDFQGALAILDNGSAGVQSFLQVIDSRVRSRKAIRLSAQQQRMARMCCPVTIQKFSVISSQDGGRVGTGSLVYPENSPEVVDLLFIAEWSVLRTGLRQWEHVAAADQPGCLTLGESSLVHETAWNFRDGGSVPHVALMDYLDANGWQRGHIAVHTLDSEKLMAPPLAKTGPAKPYMQCLACLRDILTDAFPALPTGQPAHYYSCVLVVTTPERILLGQPCFYYASVLRAAGKALNGGPAVNFSAEDHCDMPALLDNEDAPANEGEDGEEEPMCFTLPAGSHGGVKRAAPRLAAGAILDEEPAIWRKPERKKAASQRGRKDNAPGSSNDRLAIGNGDDNPGGESQLRQPPQQPAPSPALAPASQKRKRRKGDKREVVCRLEGQDIFKEVHLTSGQLGHYVRLVASCPYCDTVHEGCEKKRSISENQTQAIGEKEPLAFLGCWLQCASLFEDRASHMKFRPTLEDVRAYAKEQGWAPQ